MTRYYSETEVVAEVEGMTRMRFALSSRRAASRPAERDGRLAFGEADVARVRLLAELATDFDLDEEAAAVVVSLVDQVHGLRGRCAASRPRWPTEPEEVRARTA